MAAVSIGMPIYNNPRHLEQAIDSLLTQSYADIELLISDNASPNPRVREICERYARQDKRVRYFRQPSNIGMFENFNYVYQNTNSPFFMWASDDDWWEPQYVERGMSALAAHPAFSAWACQYDRVQENGTILKAYPPITDRASRGNKRRELIDFLMDTSRRNGMLIYALFRRDSVAESLRVMMENRDMEGADHIFVYAFFCRHDLTIDPEVLFHKRTHDRPPVYANNRAWRRLKRNFAGYSRASAGTSYAAMTRLLLPVRAVLRFFGKIVRFFRKFGQRRLPIVRHADRS
jgi:glycosyltransferase involved in cell wall biosynthesis